MKKVLSDVFAAAALLLAAGAQAQVLGDGVEPLAPVEVMQNVYPVGYPPATYSSRAIGTVYNNGGDAGTNTNGTTLGVTSWGDEMDFTVGPWAGVPTRLATQLIVWVQASGTLCPANTTQQYDILVDFWADADHNYDVSPMITGGATSLGSLRVAVTATCGVQTGWIVNLTGLPGGGVTIPSDKVFIQYRLVDPGTTTLRVAGANQTNFPVFGIGTTLVGTSTPSYARDVSLDQVLQGGTPVIVGAGAGHEHRRTSATLNTNQRSKLSGDIPPPPEPTNEDLGTLTDAGLVITRPIAAGETKWFKFTITTNAADNFRTFLDIDGEGSTAANTSIGLYNAGAGLVSSDFDDGSGTNPQLTFGIGRRAAVGDGRQYDGRDAELVPGTYLLAVSSGNANFGDAYSVTTTGTDAGDVTLHFATNVNGTPLAPAVIPAGSNTLSVGQLLSPGSPGPTQTVGRLDTVWYSFDVCAPVSGANFLDIDLQSTATTTDTEIFLYDASANLLAQNDDDGGGALSLLSFGNAGPRAPQDPTAELQFTGQNGNLPIGTYYLGVGLFNTTELTGASTDGRFHLRSASGSSLPVTLNFYTNIEQCGGGCPGNECGSQDYNGDGDFGTDQDIEAFFACLGGNCCATCFCQGSDFNGDGDFGTDQDIEAFFRVLGGGNC